VWVWLWERFRARGLPEKAKLVIFDLRQEPLALEDERLVLASHSLADGDARPGRGVALPAFAVARGPPAPARPCLAKDPLLAAFAGLNTAPVRAVLGALDGPRARVRVMCRRINDETPRCPSSAGFCCSDEAPLDPKAYLALLGNATFGFVPRGHARFSYRLLEVLGAGAVPVAAPCARVAAFGLQRFVFSHLTAAPSALSDDTDRFRPPSCFNRNRSNPATADTITK